MRFYNLSTTTFATTSPNIPIFFEPLWTRLTSNIADLRLSTSFGFGWEKDEHEWYLPCSVRSRRVYHASRFHALSHFSWSHRRPFAVTINRHDEWRGLTTTDARMREFRERRGFVTSDLKKPKRSSSVLARLRTEPNCMNCVVIRDEFPAHARRSPSQ